jgi:hypothetical protein
VLQLYKWNKIHQPKKTTGVCKLIKNPPRFPPLFEGIICLLTVGKVKIPALISILEGFQTLLAPISGENIMRR